jgi:hypothetical protein
MTSPALPCGWRPAPPRRDFDVVGLLVVLLGVFALGALAQRFLQ